MCGIKPVMSMKEVSLIASLLSMTLPCLLTSFKALWRHCDADLSTRNSSFVQAKVARSVVSAEKAADAAKEAEYKTHLRTRCATFPLACAILIVNGRLRREDKYFRYPDSDIKLHSFLTYQ